MEQHGSKHRNIKIKELVQVTLIVAVVDEFEDGDDESVEKELILTSNRRPLPVPYTEEP